MADPTPPDRSTSESRESKLRLIADSVPALIAYYDVETLCCQFASRSYAEFHGWTTQSILGKPLNEVIGEAASQKFAAHVALARAGENLTYTREHTKPSGETRMIEVNLQPHFDDAGVLEGMFVLITDITNLWNAQQSLLRSEARMRKFAEATDEGILFHKDMMIGDVNEAMCRISGYSREEAIGRKTLEFLPERWHEMLVAELRLGREAVYELTLLHKDGHEIPIECVSRNVPFEGETLRLIVVRDITARRQAQARIEFQARHDSLTQLPNRAYLMERLDTMLALARRHERMVAVLFVDLDRFKRVNDSLGHHVGDGLLREVARRISSTVRDADVVSRLGGDEFIVVLSDVATRQDATAVAGKLIENISTEMNIEGHPISVSPSIGISVFPADGESTGELVRHADAAMHHAKEKGRANYQLFKPAMFQQAYETLDKERQLKTALVDKQFVVHYQPKRKHADGDIVGLEALVRWQHPTRGLVGPDEFIGFAEAHGLIAGIDRWVLETACRQLKAWHAQGCAMVTVAVNMSALSFKHRDLVQQIAAVLKEIELEPKYLEIEITESLLIENSSEVLEKLQQLHAMGIRLTIDDFGTGYSSLAYLKRFPIDKLKIDRSFVSQVTKVGVDRAASSAIPTAIIQMARSLSLETVAEGVETQEQLETLSEMGCDQFQGNLISHPVSAQDVRAFIHC